MLKSPTKLQSMSLRERDVLMAKPIVPAVIALVYGAYKFFDLGTDTAHWPYTYAVFFGAIAAIAGVLLFAIEASKPTRRTWFGTFSGLFAFVPYLFSIYVIAFIGCYGIYLSFGPFSVWGVLAGLIWIALGYRMIWTLWIISELAVN